MQGRVIESREAVLPVVLLDDDDQTWEIDGVIGTGSTGELTLPRDAIEAIQLNQVGSEAVVLADRQVVETRLFEARLIWNNLIRRVRVVELEQEPLIGMTLLEGSRLTIDIVDGGDVAIAPLPIAN